MPFMKSVRTGDIVQHETYLHGSSVKSNAKGHYYITLVTAVRSTRQDGLLKLLLTFLSDSPQTVQTCFPPIFLAAGIHALGTI